METLKNINMVSRILFLVFCMAFLTAFIFVRNAIYPYQFEMFLRLADIPLAFVALLFALTSIKLSMIKEVINLATNEEEEKIPHTPMLDYLLMASGIIIFSLVLIINFYFPDQI